MPTVIYMNGSRDGGWYLIVNSVGLGLCCCEAAHRWWIGHAVHLKRLWVMGHLWKYVLIGSPASFLCFVWTNLAVRSYLPKNFEVTVKVPFKAAHGNLITQQFSWMELPFVCQRARLVFRKEGGKMPCLPKMVAMRNPFSLIFALRSTIKIIY